MIDDVELVAIRGRIEGASLIPFSQLSLHDRAVLVNDARVLYGEVMRLAAIIEHQPFEAAQDGYFAHCSGCEM